MFSTFAFELGGDPKQGAIDGGAIVIGQLDDAGFGDETAEFDQMSGAFSALDLPRAHVIASLCRLPAIVGCPVVLERCDCCGEMPEQFAGTCFRKTSLHAWPMPHALRRLSSQRLRPVRRPVRRC
ncbi:mll5731 [Mesorhizobium japonicum MAFF 303099]|uniref:Mll5731 protein n=1 Tax=Mesorhizobium japonicum (strain LMG 29417 / CECT 9101 / MAFF 303099) TaxID=266835 RepID=Q98B50_RHILO|nr:mll5731 [Mesorhizobium japonicum MAFF 303099]